MKFSFKRLVNGLSKTKDEVFGKIRLVIGMHQKIDDDFLDEVEEILIKSDVGVSTTQKIIDGLIEANKDEKPQGEEEILALLKREIGKIFSDNGSTPQSFFEISKKPYVIMIVGVNGTGKTTTIGKLAKYFHDQGKNVLLAACDTFRAAAVEQLEIWAQRSQSEIVKSAPGGDSAAVAFDAMQAAVKRGSDVVIIDTAGRLHTKLNLLEELKKIKRVVNKVHPGAPHETLLVIDATTGQNGMRQVKVFDEALELTGLVLTKLDGTAKGGIVVAIADQFDVPVKLVGLGEQVDDLDEFSKKDFVEALFQ
jgi:fused signal recognition particle receptor